MEVRLVMEVTKEAAVMEVRLVMEEMVNRNREPVTGEQTIVVSSPLEGGGIKGGGAARASR